MVKLDRSFLFDRYIKFFLAFQKRKFFSFLNLRPLSFRLLPKRKKEKKGGEGRGGFFKLMEGGLYDIY